MEEKLSPLELNGLKAIKAGQVVEMHVKARLEALGLIEHKLGGWVVTHKGLLRLAKGK